MAARRWRTLEEAIDAMERGFNGIEILMDRFQGNIGDPAVLDSIGMSLYRNFREVCEAVLYLVDWEKADINGTEVFPQLKDLNKKGDLVDVTLETKYAANGICDMKELFEEGPITPGMIRMLLEMVDVFLEWAWGELCRSEVRTPSFLGRFKKIREVLLKEIYIGFTGDIRPILGFRYVGDKDLDNMTDEEIDALYRPKKANGRKSMSPLFIYLILKEHSDPQHHLHHADIQRLLEEEYEVEVGRAAVGRYLQNLADEEKTNIWVSEKEGCWYSEDKPSSWLE